MSDNAHSFPSEAELQKLPPDGGPHFNRLVFEKSPYLLQHAANPVDWRPWSEEAFVEARLADKPIFLSIGYATCHWCHVMEHESFEDADVANLLNSYFVCIKIDREERPDVDQIYMSVCQAMTGRGGWPLTVLLTPELKPFFAGTYFPKTSRPGRIGMMDLLPRIHQAWTHSRQDIEANAQQLTERLLKSDTQSQQTPLNKELLVRTFEGFQKNFDSGHGGFGSAPKFPTPHQYRFLLRYAKRQKNNVAEIMVTKTLQMMRRGGIFDHIGFGFHRYSTDNVWLLPHFEKMLYDQALLTITYMEAFQATGDPFFRRTAEETIDYVFRVMTHPEGGFYSAEDADSEGEEGKFYVWSAKECQDLLTHDQWALFSRMFHIEKKGNFHDEATRQPSGTNIPHRTHTIEQLAKIHNRSMDLLEQDLETIRCILFNAREQRIHPLLDDKILTDWNGLMIAALAKSYTATGEERYLQAAERALHFIWTHLRTTDGKLLKRFRNGHVDHPGLLDDYTFTIMGCIELYQACFEMAFLERAMELTETCVDHFWDRDRKGFYPSEPRADLIARMKDLYDGAIPSGNSVMADNLARLGILTGRSDWSARSQETLNAFSARMDHYPMGYTHALLALDLLLGPAREVVAVLPDEDLREIQALWRQKFLPRTFFHIKTPQRAEALGQLAPFTSQLDIQEGKPTFYICEDHTCQLPLTDLNAFIDAL